MTIPVQDWATVADDAVKVGLGAIIGAAGAVFVAFLNHRHLARSESEKRRIEFLKEISSRFAVASGDYRMRIGVDAQLPFIPESEKLKLELLQKQRDAFPASDKLRSEFDQIGALANIGDFQTVLDSILEF